MNIKDLIANSHLAFLNQENQKALELAMEAIKLDKGNPDAYKCAGNAYMSLGQYDDAIRNYSLALGHDPDNGNRYYDLGFALASDERLADALKNLAKAEELGCVPENLVQLYSLLGVICFDIGRYDDALINLNKAEQLTGVNLDILQRKAIIYGIKDDMRNGLMTANQIKLVSPSEYMGYKIAFQMLIQSKRLDAAEKELERAGKYALPSMDIYFDRMTLELERYQTDSDKAHFERALEIIDEALRRMKPDVQEVVDSYINAAEIYLQLEDAQRTIECLNAAQAPIDAYNNGFQIRESELTEPRDLTDDDIEEMIEEDRKRIEEEYGDYGLEELAGEIEPDEDGNRNYFTEMDEEPLEEALSFKLEEPEGYKLSADNGDQINRLFIGAYTLLGDFERVAEYARVLQASDSLQNAYIGIYTEANAMKELNLPDWKVKYAEAVKFFRNAMIKDPTDIIAVTFRIQCCIDLGNYAEAEELCSLLAREVREPLQKKIKEAKAGGD